MLSLTAGYTLSRTLPHPFTGGAWGALCVLSLTAGSTLNRTLPQPFDLCGMGVLYALSLTAGSMLRQLSRTLTQPFDGSRAPHAAIKLWLCLRGGRALGGCALRLTKGSMLSSISVPGMRGPLCDESNHRLYAQKDPSHPLNLCGMLCVS